jgi:membrane dipeptidase
MKTIRALGASFSVIDLNKDLTCRAFCAEDIRQAKKKGKVAFICDLEVQALSGILDRTDIFYGLGVKGMGLTYSHANDLGCGTQERKDDGLSYLGMQVIERMNQLGMIVNISHAGRKTALEALDFSSDPCCFTHATTNLYPYKINEVEMVYHKSRTDEEIKICAEKGGLIGIEAAPNTLSRSKRQGIWDVLDHIDHAVNLIGVDHVAIGPDNNLKRGTLNVHEDRVGAYGRIDGRAWWGPKPPWKISESAQFIRQDGYPFTEYVEGFYDANEWPNITRGLISRGYSDQEIEKILGSNYLKYFEKVVG